MKIIIFVDAIAMYLLLYRQRIFSLLVLLLFQFFILIYISDSDCHAVPIIIIYITWTMNIWSWKNITWKMYEKNGWINRKRNFHANERKRFCWSANNEAYFQWTSIMIIIIMTITFMNMYNKDYICQNKDWAGFSRLKNECKNSNAMIAMYNNKWRILWRCGTISMHKWVFIQFLIRTCFGGCTLNSTQTRFCYHYLFSHFNHRQMVDADQMWSIGTNIPSVEWFRAVSCSSLFLYQMTFER